MVSVEYDFNNFINKANFPNQYFRNNAIKENSS